MKIQKFYKKRIAILGLILAIVLGGCSASPEKTKTNQIPDSQKETKSYEKSAAAIKEYEKDDYKSKYAGKKPVVTIEMEDGSKIVAELYPEIAPRTVDNFVSLIQEKYYDGTIFHRVIPGFMIQGGDPTGTGMGGPDYGIPGEFSSNGFKNELKHTKGVLSMARTKQPNSASSQFFIMAEDYPSLDGEYASFGKVIEGQETVDKIVSVDTDRNDKPLKNQAMKQVTVEIK